MNQISPKKLLQSKWTAAKPIGKDKHFIVVKVEFDDEGVVIETVIQALMSKVEKSIDWRELKDTQQWLQGWK